MKTAVKLAVLGTLCLAAVSLVPLAAASTSGGVRPAQVTPSAPPAYGCAISHPGPRSVAVQCAGGSGQVRVVADCVLRKPGFEQDWTEYGPWVPAARTSSVTCGNTQPDGWYEIAAG